MNHSDLVGYLSDRWASHTPRKMKAADGFKEAAVLVGLTDSIEKPQLLLTQRSSSMPTHKGEVAFPGGKTEPQDANSVATALREAEEEVGLSSEGVVIIGELDQVISKYGFVVTPVLAVIPEQADLTPDPRELDSLFHVPVNRFFEEPDDFLRRGSWVMPSYDYDDYRIWGLTAFVIAEMMNRYWDTSIEVGF